MDAIIITIGDELLNGQVVNTNASSIAEKLGTVGIGVRLIISVGDNEADILTVFQKYHPIFDVMIVTGGLGPTHDDITRSALCRLFNTGLVQSVEVRKNVESFLRKRNGTWSKTAEDQTYIADGAVPIPNKYGTAPGELIEKDNKYFIAMPGVPYEMESMMEDFVVPYFRSKAEKQFIFQRTFMTTGIPESGLVGDLGDIDAILQYGKLAFLPSPTGVRMRISVTGTDADQCEIKLRTMESIIRSRTGKYIYGTDGETLAEVLGKLLTERRLKIAVAESCTGGIIAHKITDVSGSSQYFERALITYSNASKTELLLVPSDIIKKHGAVSKEVAETMAAGIRRSARVDIGLSTTGIAGPTGGSAEKPAGLVWIGYSDESETTALRFYFGEGRPQVKERAAQAAMNLVRRKLLKMD